jgi:hypothetical protein
LRKAGEQKRAWLSSSDTVAFRSIGQGEGLFGRLDVRWPFGFRSRLALLGSAMTGAEIIEQSALVSCLCLILMLCSRWRALFDPCKKPCSIYFEHSFLADAVKKLGTKK